MKMMVLSMLTLAALATGFLFCPSLRQRMTVVLFGQQAQVEATDEQDDLAGRAADLIKDTAASALRSVSSKTSSLTGKTAATSHAHRPEAEKMPSPGETEADPESPPPAEPVSQAS